MAETALVTGGAGFIGSHIADALLEKGYHVVALDCLDPQVHGPDAKRPDYLNDDVELVRGDIRDRDAVAPLIERADVVLHEAAAVGVGQSMYAIQHYVDVNSRGAAVVLEAVANAKKRPRKMLVASSMSIYGEGSYDCDLCGRVYPSLRPPEQLQRRDWEMHCPTCNAVAEPAPTDETKPLAPTSVYAVTKRDHEELFLSVGRAYDVPTVALRYFNVYGPRQALSNPYTGLAAICCGRLLNGNAPLIFEDGEQSRDFIHVRDIARANVLAVENDGADYCALNVGTGRRLTVMDVARTLCDKLQPGTAPEIVGKFREGDIRHCCSDISAIRAKLGYEPTIRFEDGMDELIEWVKRQHAEDRVTQASGELDARGLIK
jgi:dTDP-L-rhamnose 4-epimerase